MWGGMWAVAITDFLQMIIIVIGMLYIGWDISQLAGGVASVVTHAVDAGKFSSFWPERSLAGVLGFAAAGVTSTYEPPADVLRHAEQFQISPFVLEPFVLN